ncbi:MAG: chromosome segregation protein SMC [Polyangiaceae bacterium]
MSSTIWSLHDASHRLLEMIVIDRVERGALEQASAATSGLRDLLRGAETVIDTSRVEAASIEAEADSASQGAFEADNEVTTLHAEIERASDRLSHLGQRLEAGQSELEDLGTRRAGFSSELEALVSRVNELSGDERAREADALAETEALSGLQAEETHANEEVLSLRKQSGGLSAQAAALEARVDGVLQRVADARTRRDRLAHEQEGLEGERAAALARQSALETSVAELAEGKRLTETERESLRLEAESLRGRQLESERAVDAIKNELGLRRNRLRALEDLHRRLEGVGAGARALLKKGDQRVLGMVADRVQVPEDVTLAVAGLLGTRLQTIVVADADAGLSLLADLAQNERGRADVIAACPGYVAGATLNGSDQRVLGRLADRVSFAPQDEALVRSLFGNALLVSTPADAAAVARDTGNTVVALDGTVARADGVVSGGSGDDVASAMIEQKREMSQLAEELGRLETDSARLVADHNALRARVSEVSTALDRARQEAHQGELAHVTAEKDLARTQAEIARVEKRLGAIVGELGELARTLQEAESTEAESRVQLDSIRAELEQLQHSLARAEDNAAAWRERVAAQSSLVTERRVRLAQVKEQLGAARAGRERVEAGLAEVEARVQRLSVELDEAAAAYGETGAKIMLAREARIGATERAKLAHAALDTARERLEGVRTALNAQEGELRKQRDELSSFDEAARKHEMAVQRIELEREHLLTGIRERFRGLELPRVVGDYHARPAPDAEHRRRIDELSQLIDRMGPVNLDAKAEHDDAERRFKELNDQKVDIEKALEELDNAIRHMNRESRKRFRETFDEVNNLFKKTFAKMFRGGKAELQLTNPEDLLGSGVEIMAQPPGKKVGTIDLLSGGEKALTAVSLIFAIFQHRPSPFCILDEVDAPLDEANVARYNEMVRAMTSHSQFILITHIKKTMQSVDVLYGVTMGEPGVSRIVSVKVNEHAVVRSDSIVARSVTTGPREVSTAPPASDEAVAGVA